MPRRKVDGALKIINKNKRKQCCKKRLKGLLLKAMELSQMCGCKIDLHVLDEDTNEVKGGRYIRFSSTEDAYKRFQREADEFYTEEEYSDMRPGENLLPGGGTPPPPPQKLLTVAPHGYAVQPAASRQLWPPQSHGGDGNESDGSAYQAPGTVPSPIPRRSQSTSSVCAQLDSVHLGGIQETEEQAEERRIGECLLQLQEAARVSDFAHPIGAQPIAHGGVPVHSAPVAAQAPHPTGWPAPQHPYHTAPTAVAPPPGIVVTGPPPQHPAAALAAPATGVKLSPSFMDKHNGQPVIADAVRVHAAQGGGGYAQHPPPW